MSKTIITQASVERGIKYGTPARILLNEISSAVEEVRNRPQVVPGMAEQTWRNLAISVDQRERSRRVGGK